LKKIIIVLLNSWKTQDVLLCYTKKYCKITKKSSELPRSKPRMPPPPKKKQKRKTITITNYNTTNNIQTLPKYNYTTLVNKSNATT
jgi:hypothetical protein